MTCNFITADPCQFAEAAARAGREERSIRRPFIDFALFQATRSEFVKVNPRGQVRSGTDDGRIITNATVICEYLDGSFRSGAAAPKDLYWRAQMRIWTKFIDEISAGAYRRWAGKRWARCSCATCPRRIRGYVARVPIYEQQVKWRKRARDSARPCWKSTAKVRYSVTKLEAEMSGRNGLPATRTPLADICTYAIAMSVPHMMPEYERERHTACNALAPRHRRAPCVKR